MNRTASTLAVSSPRLPVFRFTRSLWRKLDAQPRAHTILPLDLCTFSLSLRCPPSRCLYRTCLREREGKLAVVLIAPRAFIRQSHISLSLSFIFFLDTASRVLSPQATFIESPPAGFFFPPSNEIPFTRRNIFHRHQVLLIFQR